ncbi:17292_t:CDS:2 [Entrophospora sp. SA101]|nr:17292_t:CDS:2 [Entrophospora sp. SA101]
MHNKIEELNFMVAGLVGQEIEHTFQKGDKKLGQKSFALDGAEVTAKTGEKIKVNDVELLIAQRKALASDLVTKKKDLASKEGYTETYANLALQHDQLEAISDYNAQKFTPTSPSGATPQDYKTNLYEVNLYTGGGHKQKSIKITEQELIKLITRTLAEIKKIDKDEFANLTNTPPTGLPALTFTATSANAGAIQGQLKILQDHAQNLVEFTDAETGRKEYSFGHGFVKEDETGMIDTLFNKTKHDDVKAKVLKEIPEQTELVFIPAQDEPYTAGRKEKIISSFDTDIYTTFYNDYRQVIEENNFGSFANGGHNYTLLDFPKYFHKQQALLYKLKALMKSELKRVGTGGDELRQAEEEVAATKKALQAKETEIDTKITARINELRAELKDK